MPTSFTEAEGNIAGSAMRELAADSARSENHCMHGISTPELVLAAHPYDAALLGAVEMALGCARPLLENPARNSCVANDNRRDSR